MNRCILFCLVMVWVSSTSSAQTHQIDSLQRLIPEAGGDFAKVDQIYTDLAFAFHERHDAAMCFIFFDKIIQQAPDSSFICKAWRNKTKVLFDLERFDEGMALGQRTLALARRNGYIRNEYVVLNTMGVCATIRADYSYALKCLYESVITREKFNESAGLVYGNIGLVLYKLQDFDAALPYFHRSLTDGAKDEGTAVSLINIALCYFNLKNFAMGEQYLEKARPLIKSETQLANWCFSHGLGRVENREFSGAKEWLNKSLKLARGTYDPRFEAESLVHLGRAYRGLEQYDSSLAVLTSAFGIAERNGYNEIALNVLRQFISSYKLLGHNQKVAEYNAQYIEMRKRVHPLSLAMEKAKAETLYYEVTLQNSKRNNEQVLQINRKSIAREKFLNLMVGLCSLLMLIATILVVKSIRIQHGFACVLNERVSNRTEAIQRDHQNLTICAAKASATLAHAQQVLALKNSFWLLDFGCGGKKSRRGYNPIEKMNHP
jgi:tetratricopeptide (TPR) repeat protein